MSLATAAATLATWLKTGADLAGWDVTPDIAAVEPSFDCDQISLWVESIVPQTSDGGCTTTLNVTLRFGISMCIGMDEADSLIFTEASTAHLRLWQIVATLASACCGNTLLGDGTDSNRLGNVTILHGLGDVPVWSGTVSGIISG